MLKYCSTSTPVKNQEDDEAEALVRYFRLVLAEVSIYAAPRSVPV